MSKQIINLNDKLYAQLLKHFVLRVYRVAGITWIQDAPIMDAGSGFFIRFSQNKRYFLMTCHQHRRLKGTGAAILPHNKSEIVDEKHNITNIWLFDGRDESHPSEDFLLDELDVAVLPFPESAKKKNNDIREFDREFLWGALTEPTGLKKLFGNLFFCGFPSKDNGGAFYERNHMGYHATFYQSADWEVSGDTIIIRMDTDLGRGEKFNEIMQGLSGSPILVFKINERNDKHMSANVSGSVIGVITHIESENGIVYGTHLLSVFKEIGIKEDVADSVSDFIENEKSSIL